jgi:NAD(P)-dependent dehydrogenase (short-subunit alcohol dehydrogenase family)
MGEAVAVMLAERGADVALVYRTSVEPAERAAVSVRALGRRAHLERADLSDPIACAGVVDAAVAAFGRLDVLVHMASVYREVPFAALDAEAWDRQMAVDLRAAFLTSMAVVPHLRRQGGGRIVHFTDWIAASGRPRYPGYLPYYVAKAGVKALTEALALELAPDRILVNAVAPGPIVPPPGATADEHAAVERATPLGRWGGATEVAKAVAFLCESDFVTGETIRVDGGRHVK